MPLPFLLLGLAKVAAVKAAHTGGAVAAKGAGGAKATKAAHRLPPGSTTAARKLSGKRKREDD